MTHMTRTTIHDSGSAHSAEQRRPHQLDHVIKRIDLGDKAGVGNRADRPHDRRDEHRYLDRRRHELNGVAKPVATTPITIDSQIWLSTTSNMPGIASSALQPISMTKIDRDRNNQDHGVQKHDEAAPDHPHDIDRIRQADLLDDAGIFDEGAAGFHRRARDKAPGDQPHRDVGQEHRDVLVE